MKKLYDLIWIEETNKIGFEEITVLETNVLPGASLPTHKIRRSDGSIARCGTEMYHETKKAALAEFISDLSTALKELDQEEKRITEQRKKYKEALALARHKQRTE